MPDSLPKYDPKLESAVVGACLLSGEACEVALQMLKATDFYKPEYRSAFKAIGEFYATGKPVDEISVGSVLGLSDSECLFRCVRDCPSAANVEHYCEGVRSLSLTRALQELSLRIQQGVDRNEKPEEILSRFGQETDRIQARLAGVEGEPVSIQSVIEKIDLDGPSLRISGLACGVADGAIDALCDGWEQPSHTIIAARASMGKSTFSSAVLRGIRKMNPKSGRPLIFTTENSAILQGMASLGAEAGLSILDIKRRTFTDQEREKVRALIKKKMFDGVDVVEAAGWTVNQIEAVAKRHARKHGLSAILVDMGEHLKSGLESKGKQAHCAAISSDLFAMTKRLRCATIVTVQINRESLNNDSKKPDLSNLKNSGAWEEDSDRCVMLHRPSYYGEGDDRTEVMLKKDRLSGQAGRSCFVQFDRQLGRFVNAMEEKRK